MKLSRRHLIGVAAGAAAGVALPAAAVATAAPAAPVEEIVASGVWYVDPVSIEWKRGRHYWYQELITIDGNHHFVLRDHISGDQPAMHCISRPLRVEADGRFVEAA